MMSRDEKDNWWVTFLLLFMVSTMLFWLNTSPSPLPGSLIMAYGVVVITAIMALVLLFRLAYLAGRNSK